MKLSFVCLALLLAALPLRAEDWPQWGRDNSRNMVSPEKHLPDTFAPGKLIEGKPEIDPATTKNIKWIAKLGDSTYGNPVVSGGKVYVGTNNHDPRNPARTENYCVLMCLSEADGKFLWQLTIPRLAAGDNVDNAMAGLSSSPTIDGNRIYLVTNRCEVLCLTTDGLANGNQGPFTDEAKYVGGEVGAADADIVWRYDMRDELGVNPHQMTASSVLVAGDRLYVTTSNGVDWTAKHIPAPGAPALICLDKKTGKLLGEERSGISARTLRGNWSSPAAGKVAGKEMVIFGGGDGFCYGFDPVPADGILKEIWRCDCNPPSHRTAKSRKPAKYGDEMGPAEILATPVLVNDRVYVAIGQHPELGTGAGALVCIDATRTGDITATGKLWSYEQMRQTAGTASVLDGMVIVADHNGVVHCVDAETGKPFWKHDTENKTAASTLVADGKIYFGGSEGVFTIMAASKEEKVIATINFDDAGASSAIAANGVLYFATSSYLYAIHAK